MNAAIRPLALFYGALTLCHLLILYFELGTLHLIVKPMFMPILMFMLYRGAQDRKSSFFMLMQFGLLLSWFGDIALMLDRDNPLYFIAGLSFFLLAHLGYTAAFVGSIRRSSAPFSYAKSIGLASVFILFTGVFFSLMQGGLGEMYVPVLAYTLVITAMGIAASVRHGHAPASDYGLIVWGAVLFILSDCVIAWNKFVVDFPYDQVLNMSLYLSGQFLLAYGTVIHLGSRQTR
ncbi:MAG: lysoplasmalogenase [Flavobacteriales bacterium]|nr:lysoplasmalogenase [Flavobacteriales bacterium]